MEAGVKLSLVNDGARPSTDDLIVDIRDGGLNRKALASGTVGDVGRDGEDQAPLGIGGALAIGDEFAKPWVEHITVPCTVGATIGPVVAARTAPTKSVIAGQETPPHLGVGQRSPKEVAGFNHHVNGVAGQVLVAIGAYRHLKLGSAIFSDAKANTVTVLPPGFLLNRGGEIVIT